VFFVVSGSSDGPVVTNELIKEALHPYPADLHIVTKVGARRTNEGGWVPTKDDPEDLKPQVRENLEHLGLSGVSDVQLTEALTIAPVVTVQNLYNLAQRADGELVDRCAAEGIAYASFFPLGGFTPLHSETLTKVATRIGATAQQVALAWLLQRSETTVIIPGTSSVAHLHENFAAAELVLPENAIAELDTIGKAGQ
jgi:pyridoxine 4-dehydrogenase